MPKNEPRDPIQLSAEKRLHVFHDGLLTSPALEIETRRSVWLVSLQESIDYAHTSMRARQWAMDNYQGRHPTEASFPTVKDGFFASRGLKEMAIITFLTMWVSGYEDEGKVAGNAHPTVNALRESCIETAFPEQQERNAFNAQLKKLLHARNKLLAHAEGEALQVEHGKNLTSLVPQRRGLSDDELASFIEYAQKLLAAVTALHPEQLAVRTDIGFGQSTE